MKNHCFIFLFLGLCVSTYSQNKNQRILDSIYELRAFSQDFKFEQNQRLNFAKSASLISNELEIDSTILKSNRNLALVYNQIGDNENFETLNKENLKLATKLSDTIAIAVAHYNLGYNFEFYHVDYDSAYYNYSKSLKAYDKVNNKEGKIIVLMAIADIQDTEKDYISSEENAIKAIKLINELPKSESNLENLWSLNNLLGVTSQNLKRYDASLSYHDKALDIAKGMRDGKYNETLTMNNQAGVYRKLLDYNKALELYNNLLDLREEYEEYDPTFYPLIIDNIAYTKVLAGHEDYDKISEMFYEAYNLSKTLGDDITKLAVTIDLSKRISSNDILLESMILLSELKEGDEGKKYLNEHIRLTDSLLQVERNVRNKFARIEFDTDEIEAENKQISKENLYLAILSIGLLLSAILIYIVISQRAKNRKLKLIQVQQKANEDIYNLMLGQQDKVDEARAKEKIRVSKELHDGVLGRLFGTRLSLDSMNFKDGKEAMMTRANYIGQLKTIEEDIRKISHELNTDFVSGTGFMDIVSELIENQTQAYGLKYEYDYTDDISWDVVTNKTKINIYRIIQESMQNIYKHANAKAIKISISLEKDVICLDIIDDGDGFDTSKSKKGIGLKNMTSRVEDINGKINFTSQSGNGTTVNVKIPYTDQLT